jgi:uncharacterized protein with GYD domain
MATFIATVKFTPQGVTNVRDTCKRAAAFKEAAKKLGGKVTGQFWTEGAFDGLLVFEAADDETAAALTLHLASEGFVHTQTARAFTAAEMEKVLEAMAR